MSDGVDIPCTADNGDLCGSRSISDAQIFMHRLLTSLWLLAYRFVVAGRAKFPAMMFGKSTLGIAVLQDAVESGVGQALPQTGKQEHLGELQGQVCTVNYYAVSRPEISRKSWSRTCSYKCQPMPLVPVTLASLAV